MPPPGYLHGPPGLARGDPFSDLFQNLGTPAFGAVKKSLAAGLFHPFQQFGVDGIHPGIRPPADGKPRRSISLQISRARSWRKVNKSSSTRIRRNPSRVRASISSTTASGFRNLPFAPIIFRPTQKTQRCGQPREVMRLAPSPKARYWESLRRCQAGRGNWSRSSRKGREGLA